VLIVDVYNVLHVTGVLPPELAGPSAADLADLVAHSRYARRGAILVCDGRPTRTPTAQRAGTGSTAFGGSIRVVFAGGGKDADTLIERLIAEHSAPRRLLVVSDDRRIRAAAGRRRAGRLSSGDFLAHLAHDASRPTTDRAPAKPDTLEPGEVDAWLREFGYEPGDRAPGEKLRDEPPHDDLDMRRWLND